MNHELEKLKNVVATELKRRKILGKFKAQLRKTVISALEETDPKKQLYGENPKLQQVTGSQNSLLLAELVREFMLFYDLDYANSVYVAEASLDESAPKRDSLRTQLKIPTDQKPQQPLLLTVLESFLTGGSAVANSSPPTNAASSSQQPKPQQPDHEEEDPFADAFDAPTVVAPSNVQKTEPQQKSPSPPPEEVEDEIDEFPEDFEEPTSREQSPSYTDPDHEDNRSQEGGGETTEVAHPTTTASSSTKMRPPDNNPDGEGTGEDDDRSDAWSCSEHTVTDQHISDVAKSYNEVFVENPLDDGEQVDSEPDEPAGPPPGRKGGLLGALPGAGRRGNNRNWGLDDNF
eukprot:TRINITY_DN60963_c1_g1_i1.p2 TRINITY_DN60963_c1_g1~~TRINITY_DN60963_c1_g1_i1.p2  ORF type:complete len:358 (+),score=55.77 TRINITY_DN60963_c1_g1_i1:39-1076(+)